MNSNKMIEPKNPEEGTNPKIWSYLVESFFFFSIVAIILIILLNEYCQYQNTSYTEINCSNPNLKCISRCICDQNDVRIIDVTSKDNCPICEFLFPDPEIVLENYETAYLVSPNGTFQINRYFADATGSSLDREKERIVETVKSLGIEADILDLNTIKTCNYDENIFELAFEKLTITGEGIFEIEKGQGAGGIGNNTHINSNYGFNDSGVYSSALDFPFQSSPSASKKVLNNNSFDIAIIDTKLSPDYQSNNFTINSHIDIVNNTEDFTNGHATAMVNIIDSTLSRLGNSYGNTNISITSINALNKCGLGTIFDLACSLQAAREAEMDVVNMSVTTCFYSFPFANFLQRLLSHNDLMIVSSTGNDSLNTSVKHSYASDFHVYMPNILSVSGLDHDINQFNQATDYKILRKPKNTANVSYLNFNAAEASKNYVYSRDLSGPINRKLVYGNEDIYQCNPDTIHSGTSFSVPLAIAGLIDTLYKHPNLNDVKVDELKGLYLHSIKQKGHHKLYTRQDLNTESYILGSYWSPSN